MTPQTDLIKKAALVAFTPAAAFLLAIGLLLALAPPAGAQDEPASATIGGADCTGDNVEVRVMSTAGEEMLVENVRPAADGTWVAPLTIPAVNEPVIANATCFAGDVAVVEYSPISLRVQPGVAVGGIIELPAQILQDEADTSDSDESTPESLPETGPFTVPATGIALALIATGAGMAFVSKQNATEDTRLERDTNWPSSHWDS